MYRILVALVGMSCTGEVGPGDIGYLDCEAYDAGAGIADCEQVDICCKQVSETEQNCWYERSNGDRYHCLSEVDCNEAARNMVCDACPEFDEDPYTFGCGL